MAFNLTFPKESTGNSNIHSPAKHFVPARCSPDDSPGQVLLHPEWEEPVPPWHLVLPDHGTVPPWHLMPPRHRMLT